MPGDVVRRFIKGEDSQRGSVTATRINCHLQVIGKPFIICDVDTTHLQPLSAFTSHSCDVHLDSWVGRLVSIVDRVTLRFSDGASVAVHPIGQVFELCSDGQMVIQWDDGSKSCCYPMQLYLVGDETTDLGDSDSEKSYVTEDESSSDESCEWETEEEEWGPVEEGVSVENVVEWPLSACSSKDLCLIVTDLKDVTKKIEELVSSMPTKGSTQTSSKFFRQLIQFFRVCREFDHVAGTKFFENEELVAMMAEIKKLNKKTKLSQYYSKQVTDGSEPSGKDSETDKSSKPSQRNASQSRDESGNDSRLEKSPCGSELREIEPTDASQSIDSLRILPSESSSGISQGLESAVDVHELTPSRDAVKMESCSDGAVAISPAVDVPTKDDSASGKSEVTVHLESSVTDLVTTLTKLCEQLMKLGKVVWLNSDAESGKLCINAFQLLGQVIASNMENISAVIRSFESTVCDKSTSEQSLPCETGSEANKAESVSTQTGSATESVSTQTGSATESVSTQTGSATESVSTQTGSATESVSTQTGSLESGSCPADAALPVDTIATSNGASEVMSMPVKASAALALKFDDQQTITDEEEDAASKTPATPAEIRAKVEFNPEGFTLVDSAPEFHHFKDQKHTSVDAKSFTSIIRKEMKLLHSCFPNGIYVKGFESRMDLFSIMIESPSRTLYEDGLFFFDVQLPNNYPSSPQLYFYISYCTERLNPNLYEDRKVCVSLLGTWTGKGTEMWHSKSNLLQVLISIQVDDKISRQPI